MVTEPVSDKAEEHPDYAALSYSARCKNSPGMTELGTGPQHSLPCMVALGKCTPVITCLMQFIQPKRSDCNTQFKYIK